MKKIDAILKFGSVRELADALHISVQAVYQWPEELTYNIEARVEYAALKQKTVSERFEQQPEAIG